MVKFWITSASEWDFMICLKAPWIFQYNPIKSPNVDFSMIIPWNLHILIQFSCFTSIRNPIKTSLNTIHIWIFHHFPWKSPECPMFYSLMLLPLSRSAVKCSPSGPSVAQTSGSWRRGRWASSRVRTGGNEGWRKGEIWGVHGILMENPWETHIWWYLMRFLMGFNDHGIFKGDNIFGDDWLLVDMNGCESLLCFFDC